MALTLTGKVIQILPLETGQGKEKEWKKQSFILEFMEGNYPKKVSIQAWGDKVSQIPRVGSECTVSINVESREYNGKWYTDVKAWKIEGGAKQESNNNTTSEPPTTDNVDNSDGLPF